MEALEGMCVRGSAVSSILTATCASWQKYTRVIHTGNTPTELTHQLCHLVLWLNSWAQSFCMSFHTGWPTPAPTHCCPCKSYPLLSLQLDQETEAFLADHTHCCPHSLIRKQRPSLQTIPIAVLTAWSGNRGSPCKPYPLLSSQLDQETEAFLANPSFFGLCYPNFTTISVTDVSFHPSLVWFRNMYPFLTIAITLVWLAWLTGCHKPI